MNENSLGRLNLRDAAGAATFAAEHARGQSARQAFYVVASPQDRGEAVKSDCPERMKAFGTTFRPGNGVPGFCPGAAEYDAWHEPVALAEVERLYVGAIEAAARDMYQQKALYMSADDA